MVRSRDRKKFPRFLLRAGRTKIGFRTLPESSKIKEGVSPPHLAATALQSAGKAYLAYVVEGHASACPQTVGVETLCDVVLRGEVHEILAGGGEQL